MLSPNAAAEILQAAASGLIAGKFGSPRSPNQPTKSHMCGTRRSSPVKRTGTGNESRTWRQISLFLRCGHSYRFAESDDWDASGRGEDFTLRFAHRIPRQNDGRHAHT